MNCYIILFTTCSRNSLKNINTLHAIILKSTIKKSRYHKSVTSESFLKKFQSGFSEIILSDSFFLDRSCMTCTVQLYQK